MTISGQSRRFDTISDICQALTDMKTLSTNQVARKVGIATKTLSRYVAQGKVPAPRIIEVGGSTIHSWTEPEVERLRVLLPKIANGRKTRHKKKQSGPSSQQRKTKSKKK